MLGTVASLLAFSAWISADPLAASCRRKIDEIELLRAKPGAVYTFSPAEINAYAREELPVIIPQGMRNSRLDLTSGGAVGTALMDFLKMQHAKGVQMNWVMEKLLEGERPVRIVIESQSSNGRAIVYLRRLEISGVSASGTVLDFMIKNFFRPLYPNAHINEWFAIGYNIDHVEVRPDRVTVFVAGKAATGQKQGR
jgi:hypothetical protein